MQVVFFVSFNIYLKVSVFFGQIPPFWCSFEYDFQKLLEYFLQSFAKKTLPFYTENTENVFNEKLCGKLYIYTCKVLF